MATPENHRLPRVLARARRAGVVVRSRDLSALLALLSGLLFVRLQGEAAFAALLSGTRAALSGAADPQAARAGLLSAGRQLGLAWAGLLGLLFAAASLSLLLHSLSAGRPGLRFDGARLAAGPPSPLSPAARLSGLWTLFKVAMVALVIAGLGYEALPALSGLLSGTPADVGAAYLALVDAWLFRLVLLACPIVALDIVVQRYRHRLVLAEREGAISAREAHRLDAGDPRVRAHLRAHLRGGAGGRSVPAAPREEEGP